MNNVEESVERFWKSWPIAVLLLLVCLAGALWAVWVTPSPGVAIGILGAVAAVMSLRPEMHQLEKAGWIAIVTTLLVAELHSIRDNDKTVADERTSQQAKLETLNSESHTIIDNLRTTLSEVDTTLKQTQPHAAIRFDRFEITGVATNPTFAANVPYRFNYYFTNGGSVAAENIRIMANIYTGKADDKATQIDLARQFGKDWKSASPKLIMSLAPDVPRFGTVEKTLSDEEFVKLKDGGTFYLLVRFQYSDASGRWGTDACEGFQRNSATQIALNLTHPCNAFQDFRYPIKRLP